MNGKDYANNLHLRLYFGNLHWDCTVEDLAKFVDKAGFDTTDVYIMKDMESGQSRGFGFVTLEEGEEVDEAIKVMDGGKLMGRKITVARARPKPNRDDQ